MADDLTHEQMALILKMAGWRVAPPLTPETCSHPRTIGHGQIGADGSGYIYSRCSDCGYESRTEFPPRQGSLVADQPVLMNG